ncbi:MAG TPA: hypothetical protein DD490_00795, partial [Acidobacteria bacterium]|nr:hypothetical protein [Acidobacteriota bacterium]
RPPPPAGPAKRAASRKPKAAAPLPPPAPEAEPAKGEEGEPEISADAPEAVLEAEPSAFGTQLDTDTAERIQTLRTGIAKALGEAREILLLLEKPR